MKASRYRLLLWEVFICFGPVILILVFGLITAPVLVPYYLKQIGGILTGTLDGSLLGYWLALSSTVLGLVGLVTLIYVVRSLRRNYLNPHLLPRIRIGFLLGLSALIQPTIFPYVSYFLTTDKNLEEFTLMSFFFSTLFYLWLPLLSGIHIMYLAENLAKSDNADHQKK